MKPSELKRTGGHAFPVPASACGEFMGMTLLDFYAAEAMVGIMNMVATGAHRTSESGRPHQDIAFEAFNMAEAMIAERSRR